MPAFVKYLNQYFTKVESIDCRDYTADLSAKFDVTILDEEVKPIKNSVMEQDPETGDILKYEPAV